MQERGAIRTSGYKNRGKRFTASQASEFALFSAAMPTMTMCRDGMLTLTDIARAARVKPKAARRALEAHVERTREGGADELGATIEFSEAVVPGEMTRADLARQLARRIGLIGKDQVQPHRPAGGKTIPLKRLRDTAEAAGVSIDELRPGLTEAEREFAMSYQRGHAYWDEVRGRAVTSRQEGGCGRRTFATLTCHTPGCKSVGEVGLRSVPSDAAVIDRKFIQQGWDLDPARCPTCKAPRPTRKETTMGQQPSPAAVQAQAKMFGLLMAQFDPDNGVYRGGYSDARVASESGASVELVKAVRAETFGELKVPPEIAQLERDIAAAEGLIEDAIKPVREEIRQLRVRLGELKQRFPA